MKRIILLLSILFSAVAVNAQVQQTPEQRAHLQAMHLQKLCSTTDEQTVKAEAIFLAKINAIDAILKDTSKSAAQQQTEIDQVKADKDKELATVLTPDQFAVYRHKMDEIAARRAAGGQH